MSARYFRLISFDLDDTLWALQPTLERAEQRAWAWLQTHCPRLGESCSREDLAGRRMALLESEALRHRVSAVRIQATAEALHAAGYHRAEAEAAARAAFEVFLDARHDVQFFDRAIDTLALLQRHYRLGVITNGNACVHRLGIGHLFDFALSGEHHAAKPEPLMFRLALEQTGCTPERMIHVGDHPQYDIAAAQRLGIRTVWMNTAQVPWPGGPAADAEAHSLPGLVQAIDGLERRAAA